VTDRWFILNAPASTTYDIRLYSLDGKLVRLMSATVKAGANKILFQGEIAVARYVMKISDRDTKSVVLRAPVRCGF
jgi:hypothetical protein